MVHLKMILFSVDDSLAFSPGPRLIDFLFLVKALEVIVAENGNQKTEASIFKYRRNSDETKTARQSVCCDPIGF